MLAAALVGSVILSLELQFMLLRPRPEVTAGLLPPIPTPSFPSGHAAFTAALATFYTLARRRAAALGAAAFAALVAHALPDEWLEGRTADDPVRIACVVTGGNPDPAQVEALLG